jgi:hypothetical protein
VSCNTISIEELDKTTPVNPPTVNKKTNPIAHTIAGEKTIRAPYIIPNHLNTLIPIGTAIIIVAEVK